MTQLSSNRNPLMDSTPLIYDTVNSVIDEWIGSTPPKQFTLFDITKKVRQILGRSISIPHYGASGVHDMALGLLNEKIGDPAMGWNRVLTIPPDLPPGEPRPQLYYHLSTDPASYVITHPKVTVSLIQPDGLPAPDPQTIMGTVLMSAPKDRRLCIPKALMESQGLQPGDQVLVIANTDCLVIKKEDVNVVAMATKTYIVDLRGTIRVSSAVLDEVGLTGNTFIATEEPGLGLVIR